MNTHAFHSIKTKLVLLIALVIISIALFVFYFFPSDFERRQIITIENRVTSLAQIASYSVASAIYFDDKDAIDEQIISLIKSEEIEYVIIQTPQDSFYYAFNLELAKKNNFFDYSDDPITSDKLLYRTEIEVSINNQTIGKLFMGYSLKQLNIDMANLKTKIAWVSIIIFIIGLIAVYFIGTYITFPITKMVETVEKISAGDLTKRTAINNNDEIGFLSKSLNSMVDRIEETNTELETINKNLEYRVFERTQELRISKERAESAVKMKTEFLAQMSHEIRTPINSILSYAQLLKDETLDLVPDDLKISFDMINNGGRRLIRTVDLILNMSELQTGTYEPIIEDCTITEILEQLVGEFQTAAKTKNLDLMFLNRLDKDTVNLKADIYTLTQIFANLIDNAIKYTTSGSIEVVAYVNSEHRISVDVQDTGIGISKKFQEQLFDPFTQEEQGYTRKFEGNGLGMSLVKEYCKLNSARITVDSVKDVGTTFTVVFPISSEVFLEVT